MQYKNFVSCTARYVDVCRTCTMVDVALISCMISFHFSSVVTFFPPLPDTLCFLNLLIERFIVLFEILPDSRYLLLLCFHSRSTHLFGMFFWQRWHYICFLPTLCPSGCLVGIGDLPSRVSQHFWYKPGESQSFWSGWDAHICKMVWRRGGVVICWLFKRGVGWWSLQ